MLGEQLDAPIAGYRPGYHDAAHFNREHKSPFGDPPMRDVQRLRKEAPETDWLHVPRSGSGCRLSVCIMRPYRLLPPARPNSSNIPINLYLRLCRSRISPRYARQSASRPAA